MSLSRFNYDLFFFLSVLYLDSFRELGISWISTDEARIGCWCTVFQDTSLTEEVAADKTQRNTFPLALLLLFSMGNHKADMQYTGSICKLTRKELMIWIMASVSYGRKYGDGNKRPLCLLGNAAANNYTLLHS